MFTTTKLLSLLAVVSIATAAPTCKNKKAASSSTVSASASATYESSWESPSASAVESSYTAASASTSDAGFVQAAAVPASSSSSSSSSAAWSAPAESSTEASSTWSSAAAAETSASNGGSSSGGSSGTATYYVAGLGACGWTNSGSDFIVAMNQPQYSQDDCGKHIVITNPATGQTANAEISDLCPSCKEGSLDLSEGLFSFLNNGNMDAGVFEMEWNYVS